MASMKIRPLLGFLGRFAVLYGLLIAPWPGLAGEYERLFRSGGQALFHDVGDLGRVSFRQISGGPAHQTKVLLTNKEQLRDAKRFKTPFIVQPLIIDNREMGYLPTAILAALTLATPLPWRRRLLGFAAGILLINVFIALVLAIHIAHGFTDETIHVLVLSPFWKSALDRLKAVVSMNLSELLFAPALVWVLVSYRKDTWEALLFPPPGAPAPRPRGFAAVRLAMSELVTTLRRAAGFAARGPVGWLAGPVTKLFTWGSEGHRAVVTTGSSLPRPAAETPRQREAA
jgi:hypothetical protein